ncbi:hypothetical protein DPMN_172072 [Dreissena polymorpha]|uniref:Uncharacterized protein n=1 Tax=Dreissena polymorpha TaxID=45954 RepID=A0A9D4IER6_DREPO|nr:hypothetical protein DPMN_172072 [Dreissena polymorpha]
MTSLNATSCRPVPHNGFPSTLSVLGTAVLGLFHSRHRATASSKFLRASMPKVRHARLLRIHIRCPRPSSDD